MPGPAPLDRPTFPDNSSLNVGALFAVERSRSANTKGHAWFSCSTNHLPCQTSQPVHWSRRCIPIRSATGDAVGLRRFLLGGSNGPRA